MRAIATLSFTAALLAGALHTGNAQACGGLFCSASNPVNQAAERIIFAQDGDTVHAVIEIQYEGPPESFAWVLPVPGGEPVTVGVSSKQALDGLQQASNPQYNLQSVFENCGLESDGVANGPAGTAVPATPGVTQPPGNVAVEVVASGTVGPYDYVQLTFDPELPDPADVAVDWLEENGFDVSNIGSDLLGSYLEGGLDLIAFRLTKGNDQGSVRPIALSWNGDKPVIPIRPTAVAANDDMGVMVWVLGDARAIPENYLHLELNDAKINWFNPGPTYNQVIIAAADEAGGQGFVTEQSGPAATFRESVMSSGVETNFDYLRTGQFGSLQDFLSYAINISTTFNPTTFESEFYDGFLDVLRDPTVVPLREGATAEQLVACVSCYFQVDVAVRNDAYPSTPFDPVNDPLLAMDVQLFLDRLETDMMQPLQDTRALFDEYEMVTRFYTTLSAEEMTVDPVFEFNDELAPVDNIHFGERLFRCDGTQQVTLPQGMVLATDGVNWPVSVDDELPMNLRILQLSTSGPGEVTLDNTDRIASGLVDLGIGTLAPLVAPSAEPEPAAPGGGGGATGGDDDAPASDAGSGGPRTEGASEDSGGDGCGCRTVAAPTGRAGTWGWLASGLLLGWVVRRRGSSRGMNLRSR